MTSSLRTSQPDIPSGDVTRSSGTSRADYWMTQAELLRYLVDVLETLGAEYMVGGSQASTYYGEPRLTRDVDVIVALHREQLAELLRRFPSDEFHVDEQTAREAVEARGQFNIIHPGSGLKIDVYVNPDAPYDRARLARRHKLPLAPGVDAYFARPEDVILYKLLFHRQVEESCASRGRISTRPISRSGPTASGSAISGSRYGSTPGEHDARSTRRGGILAAQTLSSAKRSPVR